MKVAELKIAKWLCSMICRFGIIKNEYVDESLGIVNTAGKTEENRLWRFGHVERKNYYEIVFRKWVKHEWKKIGGNDKKEVNGGYWEDIGGHVGNTMIWLWMKRWRGKIHVANPIRMGWRQRQKKEEEFTIIDTLVVVDIFLLVVFAQVGRNCLPITDSPLIYKFRHVKIIVYNMITNTVLVCTYMQGKTPLKNIAQKMS